MKNLLIALSSSCTALIFVLLMMLDDIKTNMITVLMCLAFTESVFITLFLFFIPDSD